MSAPPSGAGLAGGELPPAAADRVARSLAASGLSRREAEEVGLELSAHFQDGLEKGRGLEDLLRDFGDPILAGPLIGRSVRRRRRTGSHAWKLVEVFTALVLAAYLVSFARLHIRAPEAGGSDLPGSRGALLESWSAAAPPIAGPLEDGRSRVAAARRLAEAGSGDEAVGSLLVAIDAARAVSSGLSPGHDLAALELAAEAVRAAADLPAAHAGAFSPADMSRLRDGLESLRTRPLSWQPAKVRAAFRELSAAMYTEGPGGRLTARGLRHYQAWKGKHEPGVAALLLEPAYFPNPARRGEAERELERFLALAQSDASGSEFEAERRRFEGSGWRTLRLVAIQIPLDYLGAARGAARTLDRELARGRAAAASSNKGRT